MFAVSRQSPVLSEGDLSISVLVQFSEVFSAELAFSTGYWLTIQGNLFIHHSLSTYLLDVS